MNADKVMLIVAAVAGLVFLVFLILLFSVVRIWVQALLTNTPVSVFEIISLRLRWLPAQTIVQAAITLSQRGVRVPVREIADCCLKHRSDRGITATQLATLVVAERADSPNVPQT